MTFIKLKTISWKQWLVGHSNTLSYLPWGLFLPTSAPAIHWSMQTVPLFNNIMLKHRCLMLKQTSYTFKAEWVGSHRKMSRYFSKWTRKLHKCVFPNCCILKSIYQSPKNCCWEFFASSCWPFSLRLHY